jgi:MFS family permease
MAAPAEVSIFSLYAQGKRNSILLSAATISLLTPVTDTIILPTLLELSSALPGSSVDGAAALVSAYMACVGLATLLWGPLSDTYGRRWPLGLSLLLYIGVTIACIFSPTMGVLVALRALQGCVTGSTVAITQGIVADVFPPAERGEAMGIYFVPLLVGPIISPVIGGLVSSALDWRGIFILMAALSLPLLLLVLLCIPETQHFFVARVRRERGEQPPLLEEAGGALGAPPAWEPPWRPLYYLFDARLAPFFLLAATTFGALFSSLTLLPSLVVSAGFDFPPSIVGALYLPIGCAMMAASVLGGKASDAAGAVDPSTPSRRLQPSLAGAAFMLPGCLVFGWSFSRASLPAALFGHTLIGIGQAAYGPGFFAFLSQTKQKEAAGAAAACMALSFAAAGVCISAGPPALVQLGVGGWFSLLCGVNAFALGWALWDLISVAKRAAPLTSAVP